MDEYKPLADGDEEDVVMVVVEDEREDLEENTTGGDRRERSSRVTRSYKPEGPKYWPFFFLKI